MTGGYERSGVIYIFFYADGTVCLAETYMTCKAVSSLRKTFARLGSYSPKKRSYLRIVLRIKYFCKIAIPHNQLTNLQRSSALNMMVNITAADITTKSKLQTKNKNSINYFLKKTDSL